PRPGVAVPVPGAADAAAGFQHPDLEAELAQLVQLVETGHAGPDDDDLVINVAHGVASTKFGAVVVMGLRRDVPVAASGRHVTAIHRQRVAGDVGGVIRTQVDRRIGDLAGLAQALDRLRRDHGLANLGTLL